MNQTTKPAAPTEEERKEKVRQVLKAAGQPLGPIEIAARIGEDWCIWNGHGLDSELLPALRAIGAKCHKGKWSAPALAEVEPMPGPSAEPVPFQVMTAARWERLKAAMAVPQQ